MSTYTVGPISLPPIPNVHNGTGTSQAVKWMVDATTVDGTGDLAFFGRTNTITTMLFAIPDPTVVPNWFGVALPSGITDFSRPNIYFHPIPGQNQKYHDSDYPDKKGEWPHLFYYVELLGSQLDAAQRNQIVVMPFMTSASANTCGILPDNWRDIITDILTQVRAAVNPGDTSPLSISAVVVGSFSVGIAYSETFRHHPSGPRAPVLVEVWDFDGKSSSDKSAADNLRSTAGCSVIQYDQSFSTSTTGYHVPMPRWKHLVVPPTKFDELHHDIRDFMFYHAATVTQVGTVIVPGPAPGSSPPPAGPPAPAVPLPPSGPAGPNGTPPAPAQPSGPAGPPSPAPASGPHEPAPAPVAPIGPSPGSPAAPPAAPLVPPWPRMNPPWTEPSPFGPQSPAPGGGPAVAPGMPLAPTPPPVMVRPSEPRCAPPPPCPPRQAVLPAAACSCCVVAIPAIVANVSATAQTTVTAISAIAAQAARRRRR